MSFRSIAVRLLYLSQNIRGLGHLDPVASRLECWVSSVSGMDGLGSRESDWPQPEEYAGLFGLGSQGLQCEGIPALSFVSSVNLGFHAEVSDPIVAKILASLRPGSAAAYVASICLGGQISTRPRNIHDLANALSWFAYPRLKWLLFQNLWEDYVLFLGDAQQKGRPPGRGRGAVADALTMLDEAGVICCGTKEIFFGHALLEHLLLGRTATIHAPLWALGLGTDEQALLDSPNSHCRGFDSSDEELKIMNKLLEAAWCPSQETFPVVLPDGVVLPN
jgi:hypothetical protein